MATRERAVALTRGRATYLVRKYDPEANSKYTPEFRIACQMRCDERLPLVLPEKCINDNCAERTLVFVIQILYELTNSAKWGITVSHSSYPSELIVHSP